MKTSSSEQSSRSTTSDLDFSLGDRLAKWINRKGWSGLQVALVAYLWALGTSFLISIIAGTLLPRPDVRSLLSDGFYFISETVTVFAIIMYYVWLYNAPGQVLDKLENSGALRIRKIDLDNVKPILASNIPSLIAIIVSLIAGGLYFNQYNGYATALWYNTKPVFVVLRTILVIIPTAYVTSFVIIRSITNTLVFRELLRNVNVNPMHPDQAGGLFPLGQYALRSTYVIALAGVVAALAEYSLYTRGLLFTFHYFHIVILLYVIVAPLAFFAPLGTARNAMLNAKNQLLLKISKQFNEDFSEAYKELEGSADALKSTIDKVEQLQRIQALTVSFPVWPFDVATLRRFSFTVSSPFLTIGFSILTDIIKDALT
ncbi:MAG TPA: hypothetical protein VJ972_13840 [Anaerolineales bacterium]|nr:hypothetical protein [Anaerolineales bacterium]